MSRGIWSGELRKKRYICDSYYFSINYVIVARKTNKQMKLSRKMSGIRRAAVNNIIHVYHYKVLGLVLYFRQHCLSFRRAKQYLR